LAGGGIAAGTRTWHGLAALAPRLSLPRLALPRRARPVAELGAGEPWDVDVLDEAAPDEPGMEWEAEHEDDDADATLPDPPAARPARPAAAAAPPKRAAAPRPREVANEVVSVDAGDPASPDLPPSTLLTPAPARDEAQS